MNMKQIFKKIGSVLLALCMVLTMLPAVAQPVFAADATSLKTTIESAGLSAQVDGNTVTVTGTSTGMSILLDIGEGVTVVWNATYTSDNQYSPALDIKGTGTFRVIGGTLTGGTSTVATYVNGDNGPLFIIDGGTNTLNSATGAFIYWTAWGGRLVYLSGNITSEIKKNSTSSVIAYYSEAALKSEFNSSWKAGSNLLHLKDVKLTKWDDSAYTYESNSAFTGTVIATLPDVLDLSSATVAPSVSTTSGSAITVNANMSVSYSGTFKAEDLTLTVSGAKVSDVPIADFTTSVFKINVTSFIPVTDITQVPVTMELGESLSLSGIVAPTDATKQDISWSIKDAGTTNAIINGDTLSATTTGTVTVTASVMDGSAQGMAYTKDFEISVTASTALSVDPASCTFDSLEEGYGTADITSKTFTITNKGNTTLTGLNCLLVPDGNNFNLDKSKFPSTLTPNESAEVTVKPYRGISRGTYEAAVKITSDQGPEASVPISLTVTTIVPRLRLGDITPKKLDSDFSGTGYSWNAQSNMLTLASEYEAGPLSFWYCEDETITLKLTGDVTIAEPITADWGRCINSSDLKNMIIDLGGHTLTLRTETDSSSPLDGDSITIKNGTLVAHLFNCIREPAIFANTLIVENATVIADADGSDCIGISVKKGFILKQGANVETSGYRGVRFNIADFRIESDDVSFVAVGLSGLAIDSDIESLVLPDNSTLRCWTNTNSTPPSPAGDGMLLSSYTIEELDILLVTSKYIKIGTKVPEAVVTGISVKSNPSKLTYSEGDHLDLNGLAATLTYSNATIKDVPYTAFAANNISITYADGGVAAQGDTLGTAQDGKAIILALGTHTAQTNALTVKSIAKYSITVTNGTGSGEYAEGASVTITADAAQSGKQFGGWKIEPANISFSEGSASTPSIKFIMPAEAVTATAEYTELVSGTYAINVLNDGHGVGSANVYAVVPDTEITLSAIPDSGYQFKEWQVISGGVTIMDNQFTMPAENVTVKAVFEQVTTHQVTFDLNGGTRIGGELIQTVANGGSATAPIANRSGYTFTGWDKAFTNVTSDLTVTATWRYDGESGGSSSGDLPSGGSPTSGGSGDIAKPSITVSGSTATTTVTAKAGSDGKATASVTQSQVSSAIEKAQKAAQSNGQAPKVEIQVSGGSDTSTVETTIPKSAVHALVTGEMESLTLSGPVADMTFDARAIAAIAGAASGDVILTAARVEGGSLSDAARQLVGNRPVYNFRVTSGKETISQFNGTVTLSLPYTLAKGEDANAIVAYYINEDGKPELMKNCHYDTKAGALVFTTTHFSQYAVGYNKVSFSDVSDIAWYADAISYLAARGITGGTSENTFSPDATLTRGQFITLLLRAYGIDADENPTDNFADAGNTYYTGYLAVVKRLEISSGVGDNKFAPKQAISRQDMFTLLYNALKAIDQLPKGDSGKALSDFSDSGSIASYSQEAMAYLAEADTVGGNKGQLNPTDTTTRSQMAQVLYNLLSK